MNITLIIFSLFLIKVLLVILSTDFISGLLYLWEDAHGNLNFKFIEKSIVKPNIQHDQYTFRFLQNIFR